MLARRLSSTIRTLHFNTSTSSNAIKLTKRCLNATHFSTHATSIPTQPRNIKNSTEILRKNKDLSNSIQSMLTSQVQCVLASTQQDASPAQYLMAFASSIDLKHIYIATPLAARKAQNMIARPTVSLLFDNRTGNIKDHGDGLLVTASGTAFKCDQPENVQLFVEKNPNMKNFIESDGISIFAIRVASYETVVGYERPEQWSPT